MTIYNVIGWAMFVMPAVFLMIAFIIDVINECGIKNALKVFGCTFLFLLWVAVAALLIDGVIP